MTTEEPIIRRKALRLTTTQTTDALDTGMVVMMSAEEARAATAEIRAKFGDLRQTIHDFEIREGWRALGYESFRSWAVAEIDQVGVRQVYRLLAAAEVEQNLGVTIGHTPESQLRPLAQLPPEQQRDAWQLAEQIAGDGQRQAAHVAAAAQAVGDLDPLSDDELRMLSELGGWEVDAGAVAMPGKLTMRLCRGEHWDTTETRSPGGWRYELTQLQAEQTEKARRSSEQTRGQELIERARASGLIMKILSSGRITFSDEHGAPYGGAKNLDEAESRLVIREGSIAKRMAAGWEPPPVTQLEAAPPAPQPTCRDCGGGLKTAFYSGRCPGCYHIKQAQQRIGDDTQINGQSMASWHLAQARADHARNPERLAIITELEQRLAAAEQVAAAPSTAAAEMRQRKAALAHAESELAGLLEGASALQLKLLHLLMVGDEVPHGADEQDLSEAIWSAATDTLETYSDESLIWSSR